MDLIAIFSSDRSDKLEHYGVPGMKWGKWNDETARKHGIGTGTRRGTSFRDYRSTGVKAALARRKNKKVDKSFERWQVQAQKRENAISAGKNANVKKIEYESNKTKEAKLEYKEARKEYKQSLKGITTHRKGQVKGAVAEDMSRKRLAGARKVEKLLAQNPGDKKLRKEYNRLMSEHDIERAKVSHEKTKHANRSIKKATVKRKATIAVKSAATVAAVGAGAKYVSKHYGTSIKPETVIRGASIAKEILKYI